jgi:hypothetical protein
MSEYEALQDLFHSCLNQDWPAEYDDDPWRAVRHFARGAGDLAPRLRGEVDAVVSSGATERQIRDLVKELDCAYSVEADGWSYRSWLRSPMRSIGN